MRIIITGGTGLIGRALAADLAKDSHDVIVLSRNPQRVAHLPAGARVERWDGRTAEGWEPLADGADAIVNLAGEDIAKRWTKTRKQRVLESRLNAGAAVTQAVRAARRRPKVVVQASAVGYYGPRRDEEVTEETPPGDDFLAKVAMQWEASTAPVREMGARLAVARIGIVLSNHGGALPILALPFRFFVGGRMGSGRQWWPWVHMADTVGALRFLIEDPRANGPVNVTAPHPVRNAEFVRALGRALRRPALLPAPAFALRLLLGERATVVVDGQRAVPRRLTALGYAYRFTEVGPALHNLLR